MSTPVVTPLAPLRPRRHHSPSPSSSSIPAASVARSSSNPSSPHKGSTSSRRKPVPREDDNSPIISDFGSPRTLSASTPGSLRGMHYDTLSPTQQYVLSVDQPSIAAGSPGADSRPSSIVNDRVRPEVKPRSSSIPPAADLEPDVVNDFGATSMVKSLSDEPSPSAVSSPTPNSRIHYLRAVRSSASQPNLQAEAAPITPTADQQGASTGLGIQIPMTHDAFTSHPLTRGESKPLPPTPLSRSTTGVPGGPAPLPQPYHHHKTPWKTHKPIKAKQTISVDDKVDAMSLWEASQCYIKDENGDKRRFGEFFDPRPAVNYASEKGSPARLSRAPSGIGSLRSEMREKGRKEAVGGEEWNVPGRKTVVFYIRHFWCGQCQDFTFASVSLLDPVAINKAGLNVIVISNGSWRIIKRYRTLFKCPYPIYVDETRQLYEKMGMVMLTNDFGPLFNGRAAYHQRPVPTQLLHGLKKAFVDLPLGYPGKLTQLGGEFVLGPGLKCEFAHRMTNTSNHMEAFDVLKIAGCDNPTTAEQQEIKLAEEERIQIAQLQEEEARWQVDRQSELDRIGRMKAERRGRIYEAEMAMTPEMQAKRLSVPAEEMEEIEDMYVYEQDAKARSVEERTEKPIDEEAELPRENGAEQSAMTVQVEEASRASEHVEAEEVIRDEVASGEEAAKKSSRQEPFYLEPPIRPKADSHNDSDDSLLTTWIRANKEFKLSELNLVGSDHVDVKA